MAFRYYYLVLAETTKEKHVADVAQGLLSTLDVYESFHLVQMQSAWADLDERVELSDEDRWDTDEDEEDKQSPSPPQIPASRTCKWNCKWTVCEHTALVASVFSPAYKVPDSSLRRRRRYARRLNQSGILLV